MAANTSITNSNAKTGGVNPVVQEGRKIDTKKDLGKLTESEKLYVQRFEVINKSRRDRLLSFRRKGRNFGVLLGCVCAGIYYYTLSTVRQETFLEDFEEMGEQPNQ